MLTPVRADAALAAGAAFAVAPGFNPRVVDHCLGLGLPIVPGVNSPSQVEQGMERGLSLLKFFPASWPYMPDRGDEPTGVRVSVTVSLSVAELISAPPSTSTRAR